MKIRRLRPAIGTSGSTPWAVWSALALRVEWIDRSGSSSPSVSKSAGPARCFRASNLGLVLSRAVRGVVFGVLLITAWQACHAVTPARGMEVRLVALTAAVESVIASSGGSPAPPEWRKLLWFYLASDKRTAALVILRTRRDECAAVATSSQPCRALIFSEAGDGGFKLVSEFTLRVHPVALVRAPGGVKELLYSRDVAANPVYARYRFDGEVFARVEGEVGTEALQQLPLLMADDRNMPLMADQLYAARQFRNDGARLAPYRLHIDSGGVPQIRLRNPLVYDASAELRANQLLEALQPDAQGWVAAIAWPQTLELRLWNCVDWMVERRFWAVEDRRLGRIGTCVEPALFAYKQGVVRSDQSFADLIRLQVLNQVGVAWLLRVAPFTPAQRAQILDPEQSASMSLLASVAGQWLAYQRRQMTLERMAEALSNIEKTAIQWFSAYEAGVKHFGSPTPELLAFVRSQERAMQAHQCVRRLLNQPLAKALVRATCDNAMLDEARRLTALLQKDLEP